MERARHHAPKYTVSKQSENRCELPANTRNPKRAAVAARCGHGVLWPLELTYYKRASSAEASFYMNHSRALGCDRRTPPRRTSG
jgi:hypothetical protein